MKPIARLMIRGGEKRDGLLFGCLMKGQTVFKKGRIYTVSEFMGETIIVNDGQSMLGETVQDSPIGVCIHHDIGHILNIGHRYLWLSREEYARIQKARNT